MRKLKNKALSMNFLYIEKIHAFFIRNLSEKTKIHVLFQPLGPIQMTA